MRQKDVMLAMSAWVLNVITLGGISSYSNTFSKDTGGHVAALRLKNTSAVVRIGAGGTYTLVTENTSVNWAKTFSCLAMLACMPGIVVIRRMCSERIVPKKHLLYYQRLQVLYVCLIAATASAFMMIQPFDAYIWWPWLVNFLTLLAYCLTLGRISIDKWHVYSTFW